MGFLYYMRWLITFHIRFFVNNNRLKNFLNKNLCLGGGVTPPEGCIHFKTSEAMDGVNFFESITDPNYDFSFLDVYVNDELTNIPANALIAATGDDIRIVSRSKPYPFFRPNSNDYIASIEEPLPFMDNDDFSNYFYYCTSLTSIPENLFINNPQITSFQGCFYYCISLTSIPSGLFDNNPNVTSFQRCFTNCTFLTSIPQGLFDNNPNVTDFYSCFSYCASLTSIPQGLFDNNTNVTDFGRCFYNSRKLTVNVQIGSTTTSSVSVIYFATRTATIGTVYCRAGSNAYNAFLEDTSANVNVQTY